MLIYIVWLFSFGASLRNLAKKYRNVFFVQGAINIYTKSSIKSLLLQNSSLDVVTEQHFAIVVFHCEFSSKRGPSL